MVCFIASCTYLLSNAIVEKGAVVGECLSAWLVEQGVPVFDSRPRNLNFRYGGIPAFFVTIFLKDC